MTKRCDDLELPDIGIGMNDLVKASGTKITRGYCTMVSSMASNQGGTTSNSNGDQTGAPRKKAKRGDEEEELSSWSLGSLNISTGQPDTVLHNKRINRLRKNHLPVVCKLIIPSVGPIISVQTLSLSSTIKNSSKDWIIQQLIVEFRYIGRVKIVTNDSQLLGLQQPAIYLMHFGQFCQRFQRQLKDADKSEWSTIYRGYCLEGEDFIRFPVAVLQPLNFQQLEKVSYLTGDDVRDDRVKLSFSPPVKDQTVTTEIEQVVEKQDQTIVKAIQSQKNIVPSDAVKEDHTIYPTDRMLIWFIGTSTYSFQQSDSPNLQHFNMMSDVEWNRLFTTTRFNLIKDDVSQLVNATNKSYRVFLSDLKHDQRRLFMHRLVKARNIPTELYLIVRFKQVKQQRIILLKGLKTCSLFWAPMEQYQVCYTLPQFTKEELQYLYILQQLSGPVRQQQILRLLLANFYHQHVDMKKKLRQHCPEQHKIYPLRCFECHYILHTLPIVQCFFCGTNCHKKCLTSVSEKQSITVNGEELWCCKKCLPCNVCFGPIRDPLVCHQCSGRFHRQCGKTRDKMIELNVYECQDCLACDMCEKKLKNCKDGYVLVEQNIYCEQCNSIKGDYCNVCMKSWNKQTNPQWIQCNACDGWVHKSCDAGLLKLHSKYFFQPQSEYQCPRCRNLKRRSYLKLIIDVLMKFDEYQYFMDPVYDSLIDYLDIIEHPMCFRKMEERCMQGFYDEDSRNRITEDFNLIVSNALKYNMPKDLPHKSAKIMKLMGQTTLDHFDQYMQLDELQLIIGKQIDVKITQRQRQLFRYIYNHYLQILLNQGKFKSKVVVRNKLSADLPDLMFFKHGEFLRRFKACSIDLVYQKQPPMIEHLFSLPKLAGQSIKMSATRPICYYHNEPDVISSCDICCEAFCCVEKCFLHRICSHCKTKGCRCSDWGCTHARGYSVRDLEHPLLKPYGNNILAITEMYTYCIKCCITNIKDRQCKYCSQLCSYSYIQCKKCTKRFHKNCGKRIFIGKFCYECERSPQNQNKLKQQIKQQTRKRLFKMIRIEKYIPLILRCYMQEGIRLDIHQVRQLILANYDSIEEHLDQLECYENSIAQIDKSKVKDQKIRMMGEAIACHLPQLRSKLRQDEVFEQNTQMQFTTIDKNGNNILKNFSQQKLWERYFIKQQTLLEQIDQIQQASVSCKPQDKYLFSPVIDIQQNYHTSKDDQIMQIFNFTYKITMRNLYDSTLLIRPKQTTVSEGRSQMHDYKGNQNTFKKIQQSKEVCRNLFMNFYFGLKQYPRSGSTSLINLKKHSITIYKRWQTRSGILIKLYKDTGLGKWILKIEKEETILQGFNDLKNALSRFRVFETVEEIGNFLGFHIHQQRKCDNSYIRFMQNNPLDFEPLIQRKRKVMQFYDKVENNTVQRKELFFLNKKSENSKESGKTYSMQPYLQLEELIKQLDDQPVVEKVTFKITDPTREIFIAPSTIHKLGLFSRKNHPKNTAIIEYVGEILGEPIADVRESQYHLGCYMFGVPKRLQQAQKYTEQTVDEYTPHIPAKKDVIDATFRGNQARYLNHSCDPNCASRIEQLNGQPRILIYAIRDIKPFEQLTYDYQFKVSADEKIICTCGAKNCQGRLN